MSSGGICTNSWASWQDFYRVQKALGLFLARDVKIHLRLSCRSRISCWFRASFCSCGKRGKISSLPRVLFSYASTLATLNAICCTSVLSFWPCFNQLPRKSWRIERCHERSADWKCQCASSKERKLQTITIKEGEKQACDTCSRSLWAENHHQAACLELAGTLRWSDRSAGAGFEGQWWIWIMASKHGNFQSSERFNYFFPC